jgi:hypothetical protein
MPVGRSTGKSTSRSAAISGAEPYEASRDTLLPSRSSRVVPRLGAADPALTRRRRLSAVRASSQAPTGATIALRHP